MHNTYRTQHAHAHTRTQHTQHAHDSLSRQFARAPSRLLTRSSIRSTHKILYLACSHALPLLTRSLSSILALPLVCSHTPSLVFSHAPSRLFTRSLSSALTLYHGHRMKGHRIKGAPNKGTPNKGTPNKQYATPPFTEDLFFPQCRRAPNKHHGTPQHTTCHERTVRAVQKVAVGEAYMVP